ncbi:MAG TPA: hypothetical protein ENI33_06905 [Thermoplasmatales archaeon]|nr:hypothetical protein [Thermoplasmatales archaeon]
MIDLIRLAIGSISLSYAAYSDYKSREVKDIPWIIMGISGIALLFFYDLKMAFFSMAIFFPITIIMLLLIEFSLMGGADVKAMWGVMLLCPLPPEFFIFPLIKSPLFVFPLTILINSLIMVLPIPFAFFFLNAIKKNFEFPQCFLGYKMRANEVVTKNKFVWSLEKDGKKRIFPVKDFDFKKFGEEELWVSPHLPLLVFVFFGYIVSFIFGDILFFLLSLFQ